MKTTIQCHVSSFRSWISHKKCKDLQWLQEMALILLFSYPHRADSCTIPKQTKHKSDKNKHDELRLLTHAFDLTCFRCTCSFARFKHNVLLEEVRRKLDADKFVWAVGWGEFIPTRVLRSQGAESAWERVNV